MKALQARNAVRRFCAVITREADRNPEFAQRLSEALGSLMADVPAEPRQEAETPPPMARPQVRLHAVNVLRSHGEGALRGRLEQIKARTELKAVATASGLVLSGPGAKPNATRTDLIEGIIAAAKHYDALRAEATA